MLRFAFLPVCIQYLQINLPTVTHCKINHQRRYFGPKFVRIGRRCLANVAAVRSGRHPWCEVKIKRPFVGQWLWRRKSMTATCSGLHMTGTAMYTVHPSPFDVPWKPVRNECKRWCDLPAKYSSSDRCLFRVTGLPVNSNSSTVGLVVVIRALEIARSWVERCHKLVQCETSSDLFEDESRSPNSPDHKHYLNHLCNHNVSVT